MGDITAVLANCVNPDATLRNQAEEHLKQFKEHNYAQFLSTLSAELANNEREPAVRQQAGIQIKNSLDAQDTVKKVKHCS